MPKGFKGWAIWAIAQAVVTYAIKLLIRLADNAMMGWGDDRIAEFFGFTSPNASTVFNWAFPFVMAAAALWLFHHFTTSPLKEALANQSSSDRFSATGVVSGPPKRSWIQRVEPLHIIFLGLAIALAGAVWLIARPVKADLKIAELQSQLVALSSQLQTAKTAAPPPAPPTIPPVSNTVTWITEPTLVQAGGNADSPIMFTGTLARTGKFLQIVVDIQIDGMQRGQAFGRLFRFHLMTLENFTRMRQLKVPIISYTTQHNALIWGSPRDPTGEEAEAFGFAAAVRATVVTIDDSNHEEPLIGFTRFSRRNAGQNRCQEMNEKAAQRGKETVRSETSARRRSCRSPCARRAWPGRPD
jgi:hypothetical protein